MHMSLRSVCKWGSCLLCEDCFCFILCVFCMVDIEKSWKEVLESEFEQRYWQWLVEFLKKEKSDGQRIYPRGNNIFRAFALTPFEEVKVVILWQDPYHGEGQAIGLSFSVPDGVSLPPSLMNIFKEIESDVGVKMSGRGNLSWRAQQGVFLLNAILSVRAYEAASHRDKGWEKFTDAVISALSEKREWLVFLLWGSYAKSKRSLIDESKHSVLTCVHPSPLSAHRWWFGCHHFSKANELLRGYGKREIEWRV